MSEEMKKFLNGEMDYLTADLGVSDEGESLSMEELVERAKDIMEEVNSDQAVVSQPLPPNLREKIDKRISALNLDEIEEEVEMEASPEEKMEAKAEASAEENVADSVAEERHFSAEEKELMRLGKVYKKRRKMRKYFVLAAAVVCALAFGITSMGGPERIFEKLNWTIAGREQTNIDSDSEDILQVSGVEEEEAYQQVEDEFGFYPVKLMYKPERIEILEVQIEDEIQGIYLIYGEQDEAKITYFIRPNYRTGSLGVDNEDQLEEKYEIEVSDVNVLIKKYNVEGNEEGRWSIEFSYENVQYFMRIVDMKKEEVEKIVENLYFS